MVNTNDKVLIIVDHASNFLPKRYDNLGIEKKYFNTHIAYDIGIKNLAINISNGLNAKLIYSEFTRLLIDLNRDMNDPTLIPAISEKKIIIGNLNVTRNDLNYRKKIYHNYHKKIKSYVKNSRPKYLISLHSFNPIFKNKLRKIEIGILSNNDKRYSSLLLKNLSKSDYKIGDNLPYAGSLIGDSMYKHGLQNNLLHALIEIRNDLINTVTKRKKMCSYLISKIKLTNKQISI